MVKIPPRTVEDCLKILSAMADLTRRTRMVSVSSSAITKITYRTKTKVMYVHMTDGNHIAYENVPQEVYEEFISAGSKGKYYNSNIRSNYSFRYV